MPGYLGGGGSSGGTGGEIRFPKELIDPVTKLRVSNPETLIDTDFEYGLQPTKWETLELINNTPSFFSKSGDTTIDGVISVTTNSGTREITVKTSLAHNLAVGIPINVTGTRSITADGAYIINSIPDTTTFTYLCKDNQPETLSIEDLYTSIITGEFFQGSQIRISDAAGMTTDGEPVSTITVSTDSTHGFGANTPFYFLNLNSTLSQQFDATNTSSRSFDSSNSATAQTFDGSNTLSSLNIDWSNSASAGGTVSNITSTSSEFDTITVSHSTEVFFGLPLGAPLYYDVTSATGYFSVNPRGVVFLKSINQLGTTSSTFQVSELPDGDVIDITAQMNGFFQIANQARTFAGNNINAVTQETVNIVNDAPKEFDATNSTGTSGVVTQYSGSLVRVSTTEVLDWYFGTMVRYTATGTPATGLTNNTTYFIDSFFSGGPGVYFFTLKPLPDAPAVTSISGLDGTQTFTQIFVSIDKDVFHIKDNGYAEADMLYYQTTGERFSASPVDQETEYYYVKRRFDQHNFTLNHTLGDLLPARQVIGPQFFDIQAITPTTATVVGLTAPLTFRVSSGTLPTGLTLNTSTGVISGTPRAAFDAEIVNTVSDVNGNEAFQTIKMTFTQPPQLYDFSSATFTTGGAGGTAGPNLAQARSGVGNPTWASEYLNMTQNGFQLWTVPRSATYRITAVGARGGSSDCWGQRGGFGASMRGEFPLIQGDVLKMVVGQAGVNNCHDGSGGGGTFVTRPNNTALIVAGGGGGASAGSNQWVDADTNTNGRRNANTGFEANNGGGGTNCTTAGGGGGLNGNGSGSWPGTSFVNGAFGGTSNNQSVGGFGGGGGGGGTNGAGAGGGFSGGSASCWSSGAGAGGSFNSGTNQVNNCCANNGNGFITIERI